MSYKYIYGGKNMPKKIELRTFEELTEEEQDQVLDNLRDINVDGFEWWDFIIDDFIDYELDRVGLTSDPNTLNFDLYRGTSSLKYEIKDYDLFMETFLTKQEKLFYLNEAIKLIREEKHLYMKEPSYQEIKDDAHDLLFDEIGGTLLDNRDMFYNTGIREEVFIIEDEMNNRLFEALNDNYEALITDEEVIATIEANEYLFDKCLKIACS